MSTSERLSVTVAVCGVVINLVAFVGLIWQVRILVSQLRQDREATDRDHDRRQRQATLDFYAVTLDKMAELRTTLPYDRDEAGIREMLAQVGGENDEVGKAITEYLSLFELLATGVRTSIFDLPVLDRAAGSRIRAIVSNYRPWIQQRRELLDSPGLYIELERLAGEIERHRAGRGCLCRIHRLPGSRATRPVIDDPTGREDQGRSTLPRVRRAVT